MVNPDSQDDEEKPLDPAVARVQARLQRLMLLAGLTLGVGILAVFLAIIYRITAADDKLPVVVKETAPANTEAAEPDAGGTAPPPVAADAGGAEPDAGGASPPPAAVDAAGAEPDAGDASPPPVAADATGAEPAAVATLPPVADPPPAHAEAGSTAPGTPAAVLAVEAAIPADARLIASTVAGGRIVLTYDHYGGTIVMVVDPETLQVVGRLDLKPE